MSKQIKVIYLIIDASPYGSNVALLNLLEMLIPMGVKPLVVMSGSGGICEILEKRGIPFLQLKYYYSFYPRLKSFRDFILFVPILCRTILYNLIAIKKLASIAYKYEIDIIHTIISPLHIGYHVAKKLNKPHVWHVREYQDLYYGWYPLFSQAGFKRKLQTKNTYPIAITKGLFDHYSMNNNATIIYDGVMKSSQTRFVSSKEKYFLYVGRLEEEKGIRQLIAAFIEFAEDEKEYKLLIAGDGAIAFKSNLVLMAKESEMENRISFLGFRHDVYDLMERATALIVSSRFEGFGFTSVEAMFNGCLVIGKNAGGTKEILEQEQLGILYSSKDELIKAMKEVVSNSIKECFPIIHKAQRVASSKYSCEKNAAEVYKLYQNIVKN